MQVYDTGDVSRLSILFTAAEEGGGNPVMTDPDIIKLFLQKPDTSIPLEFIYGTNDEVVRISAGSYRSDIVMDIPGEWLYRWEGTGGATAVEEGAFLVRPSRLGEVTIPVLVQYHLQRTEATLPAASFAWVQADAMESLFDEFQSVEAAYEDSALSAPDLKLLKEAIAYETAADLAGGKIALLASLSGAGSASKLKVGPIEVSNSSGAGASGISLAWRSLEEPYHKEARAKMRRISFVKTAASAGSGRRMLINASPTSYDERPYCHERRRPPC